MAADESSDPQFVTYRVTVRVRTAGMATYTTPADEAGT